MPLRRPLAWALACWSGAGLVTAAGATVRVQVVDDAGGRAVPARAYLWRGDEPLLPPGFSSYARGDERHFLVTGDFALDLEAGASAARDARPRGPSPFPARMHHGRSRYRDAIEDVRVP